MRVSLTTTSRTSALFLCLLVAGCGNAVESFVVGQWARARIAAPTKPAHSWPYTVSITAPGSGRVVGDGDVVQVRLRMQSGSLTEGRRMPSGSLRDASKLEPVRDAQIWLWAGDSLIDHRFVNVGHPTLRAALPGLREGARLSLRTHGKSSYDNLRLPTHGFTLHYAYWPDWRQRAPGGAVVMSTDYEYVELGWESTSDLEIVRICKPRWSVRSALLKQWGQMVNWGDISYAFARQGVLEWVALEAQCDGPEETLLLKEAVQYSKRGTGTNLSGWEGSYERQVHRSHFYGFAYTNEEIQER